jgi:hypothetical protein
MEYIDTLILLFYSLFNDAFSSSDYIASNERTIVNNINWEGCGRKKVLSRNLPGGTEENHEKPRSG